MYMCDNKKNGYCLAHVGMQYLIMAQKECLDYHGFHCGIDPAGQGERYIKKAVKNGNYLGNIHMGILLYGQEKYLASKRYFNYALAKENAPQIYENSHMDYLLGRTMLETERSDLPEAIKLLKSAAEQGHEKAAALLESLR